MNQACNERPSHDESQLLWTECHYSRGSIARLLSARSCGVNHVELQKTCIGSAVGILAIIHCIIKSAAYTVQMLIVIMWQDFIST